MEAGRAASRTLGDLSGVRIRPMTGLDVERILELRSVVSWSADPEAFGFLRGVRDARWAVAEGFGEPLAGMVGAVPLGETGILCHLAVRQDYRGRGLGTALSSWAVSYLRSRGARRIRLDSTPQAEKLYRSLGFEAVAQRTIYRLERAFHAPRSPVGELSVEPLLLGDLPELYGVDCWSYGADRSALISATIRLHTGRGLVVRDESGRIKGYLMHSRSAGTNRIGPFMAETAGAARLLLAHVLSQTGPGPIEAIVPDDGSPHDLFEEFGFTGRPDRLRMSLGEAHGHDGLTHYATTPYLAT